MPIKYFFALNKLRVINKAKNKRNLKPLQRLKSIQKCLKFGTKDSLYLVLMYGSLWMINSE